MNLQQDRVAAFHRLHSSGTFAMPVTEAAALGVRRISVGGTLARAAWAGFLQAAQEIADAGTFSRFARLPDVDALFRPR